MQYALIKRVTVGGILSLAESRIQFVPTTDEADEIVRWHVEETIRKMLKEGIQSDSFKVTRLDNTYFNNTYYTKIEAGERTTEWLFSAEVGGSKDAKYAVIRTYSWSLENPYDIDTTIFDDEEEAKYDLAERYHDEVECDRTSGYALEYAIDPDHRYAKITNFRASGDIDHTDWMILPVTNTLL